MSTLNLLHTCGVCGAEESVDVLLMRIVGDTETLALIADVIAMSLPLGQDVVRYLRFHKPAAQRLRVATARKVLAELVPDLQRTSLERNGRIWSTPPEAWRAAFQAVFDADLRGSVVKPLQGNGYLYSTLTRLLERDAAAAEQRQELGRRQRGQDVGPSVDALADDGLSPEAIGAQVGRMPEHADGIVDPAKAAQAEAIKAQLRDALAAKRGKNPPEAQP